MKRIRKICLTILLSVFGLFLFTACTSKENVESISLNGYSEEMPLQLRVGKFSYDEYTLTVAYDDGSTKEIALQEDMISETDKLKFFQEGKSEISISYQGAVTSVWIDVERNVFPENIGFDELNHKYTGQTITVKVEGDIPSGTKITYPYGNTFTDAGNYGIMAVLQCDGYVTKTIKDTVVVEKADYVFDANFVEGQTFVYDKEKHGISLKGKKIDSVNGTDIYEPLNLPQGVGFEYTITKIAEGDGSPVKDQVPEIGNNKKRDAGTYEVCAIFTGDSKNYNPIPAITAQFTIERADYDMSAVSLSDATFVYTGDAYSLSAEINGKIPSDVEPVYYIKMLKNGKGENVTAEYVKGNSAIDAGVYSVKAVFTIDGKNAANYKPIPGELEGLLTICPAEYDSQMQKLYLNSQGEVYVENKDYKLILSGELPEGITPDFKVMNLKGDEIVGTMRLVPQEDDNGALVDPLYEYVFQVPEAGDYVCMVTFTHNNVNYKDIELRLEAWIFIGSNP